MRPALRLALLGFVLFTLLLSKSMHAAPPPLVGINKAACAYFTIADAIADAEKGDIIFIEPGTYSELLGEISTSLTLVPAKTTTNCGEEDTSATSATVIIDGRGGSDDSTGGLVEIIDGAEVHFRHMTLKNATATNGGVIALTGGGDLILDDANVTDGVASSSGGNIYALTSGASQSTVRLINGSNVYRGTTTFGDGGAIALFGGTLTVESGGIGVSSNNGFSTAGGNGGGIYADGATVNLNSSTANVIWNQAGASGGGIYAHNSVINMTNARVENNQAAESGGGIYLTRSSGVGNDLLSATGGSISFNQTTNSGSNEGGGGLFIDGFINGRLDSVEINENLSDNVGGAISARTAVTLMLTDSMVDGNQAAGPGGAFYLAQSSTSLHLDNSVVQNNTAGSIGGGIYSAFASIFLQNNAQIIFNVADNGGGIQIVGTLNNNSNTVVQAQDSFISGNQATGSSSPTVGNGGGIYGVDVRIAMTDTYFTVNEAKLSGGGLYLYDVDSELRMTRGGFSANRTISSGGNQGGGAIYAENALELWLDGVVIEGNVSDNSGGGLLLRSGADLTMWGDSWLGYNSATGSGGAIYAANSSTQIVMTDTLVSNNFAGTTGGGMQFTFATGEFTNVEVRENEADSGGAMHLWFAEVVFENSQIVDNLASIDAGGLFLRGTDASFRSVFGPDCMPFSLAANEYCAEIRGNGAVEHGGGIYVESSNSSNHPSILTLEHAVVRDNFAPLAGTAIYINGVYTPTVTLANLLITGNGSNSDDSTTVELDGGGTLTIDSVTMAGNFDNPLWMITSGSFLTMTNSILYENLAGPRVAFGVVRVLGCNLSQSAAASGANLGANVNPVFITTARGDYRLNSTSPALDECFSGPPRDTDLGFRPVGTRFDMGAFERGASSSTFVLTIGAATGNGSGTVTSNPAGINCGGDCTELYPNTALVTLNATPAANSTFTGWSGSCSGITPCQLTMSANRNVIPAFALKTHALTINKFGSGTVTSNDASITCGGACSAIYDHNTVVTLNASAGGGAVFVGWSGACTGTSSCVVTMDAAKTANAFFGTVGVEYTVTVTTTGDGSGTVNSDPAGILCGTGGVDCDEVYGENSPLVLTPVAEVGSTFGGWSGDCDGTGPCSLAVDEDKHFTATFSLSALSYTLTVTTTGTGSGMISSTLPGIACGSGEFGDSSDCEEQYPVNSLVSLTATTASGVIFEGWSGDCVGTGICPVTMDMTRSVTATFTLITHTLSVTATGTGNGAVTSDPAGINCHRAPEGAKSCVAAFGEGTAVALVADPAPGAIFSEWSDDCSGALGCGVTMDTEHTVGAIFATSDLTFTLNVTTTGDGAGSVIGSAEESEAAIECSSGAAENNACTQAYLINTQVTLLATPDTGSIFVGWSGACSGLEVCVVNVDEVKSVTANFAVEQVNHELTVAIVGAGDGSSDGSSEVSSEVSSDVAGISCPGDCTESYAAGTVVSLTATAGVGSAFMGWSGACVGNATCIVELVSPRTVTATFGVAQVALEVTLVGEGEGVVSSTPGGITCGIDCQTDFAFAATVTLTATADAGSIFAGWGGACSGKGVCEVAMDGEQSVTARMNLAADVPTNYLPSVIR